MKNIIVMSGDIGSGKSSVATALKQLTGYDIIGTGTIQRAIATRRGLTTLELTTSASSLKKSYLVPLIASWIF